MKKTVFLALGLALCPALALCADPEPALEDCRAQCLTRFSECSGTGALAPGCEELSCISCLRQCAAECAQEEKDQPAPDAAPAARPAPDAPQN